MLLTITTTHAPGTDLGLLLGAHPDRPQRHALPFGTLHVFFPEAGEERGTAAFVLEAATGTPGRVRTTPGPAPLAARPDSVSTPLTVALAHALPSALRGPCPERPELARTPLSLELHLPAVACRPGPARAHALFAPLGWHVRADPVPLDPGLPGWGDSHHLSLTLTGTLCLSRALHHLCVLVPALEGHPFPAGEDPRILNTVGATTSTEAPGPDWLGAHPERDWITRRLDGGAGFGTATPSAEDGAMARVERTAAGTGPGRPDPGEDTRT